MATRPCMERARVGLSLALVNGMRWQYTLRRICSFSKNGPMLFSI